MAAVLTPQEAMSLAIEEGKKGSGFVSPNPLVGCVILDRNRELVAKGYHARLGDLHAETSALRNVKDESRLDGAHVYVTLEPCAHQGRQPSCAKTLAALPIASVTYGLRDPNPLVGDLGAGILRDAGKHVTLFDQMQDELEELAEIFLLNFRQKRPFVSVKVASSLDGQVALADGTSQWITGESARGHVQSLRGFHDCILTGAGTVMRDNPRLNSRDPRFVDKRLPLVILDPGGSCVRDLPGSPLMSVRKPEDVIVVTHTGVAVGGGVSQIELKLTADGEFDLGQLLQLLRARDLHSVFVEAGGQTVSSFFRQSLVDRLYLFMAPKILGKGLGWATGLELPGLNKAPVLEKLRTECFGPDILFTGRVKFD